MVRTTLGPDSTVINNSRLTSRSVCMRLCLRGSFDRNAILFARLSIHEGSPVHVNRLGTRINISERRERRTARDLPLSFRFADLGLPISCKRLHWFCFLRSVCRRVKHQRMRVRGISNATGEAIRITSFERGYRRRIGSYLGFTTPSCCISERLSSRCQLSEICPFCTR